MKSNEEYQKDLEIISKILRMSVYTNDRDWEAFFDIKNLIDELKDKK